MDKCIVCGEQAGYGTGPDPGMPSFYVCKNILALKKPRIL